MKSIIFDLDLTLVDSMLAEQARSERNWPKAYSFIPQFTVYDGLLAIFDLIRKHNIKASIVSTSPRTYVEKVVEHFQLPIQWIVGYYDAKPHKPNAAPMLRALEMMSEQADNVISFGDRVIDIQASNAANVESVACFWGTKERTQLVRSGYRHAIIEPREIITLIR